MRIASIAIIVLLTLGCGHPPERGLSGTKEAAAQPSHAGRIEIPADSPRLRLIQVAEVKFAAMPTDEFTAPGKVEINPNQVSKVILPVAGRIAEVMVRFGDAVRKNDPVLTVESPEADAAAAAALQAEAQVTDASASLHKAQQDFERVAELFKGDAIAKKELVAAQTTLAQAQSAVRQAQTAQQQATARLELFGLKPGAFRQRIIVRAALSGKVTEMNVVAGEHRNDLSASLMTIADLSSVWISAEVPESSIRLVKVGEIFDVSLTAYPGEVFHSRVARMADAVDAQTRTLKVWAEVSNAAGKLRPEMFGEVRHIESYRQVPVIPARSVIQTQGKAVVYREIAPGRFDQTAVEVGRRSGELVPVTAGLNAGDRIVVDGAMLLRGY